MAVDVRRPDRLVCFLRVLDFGLVLRRCFGKVLCAECIGDHLTGSRLRFGRDGRRVGAHVGDQANRFAFTDVDALIQLLRDLHRLRWRHVQPRRSRLLQGAGGERRPRLARLALGLEVPDPIGRALQIGEDALGVLFGLELDRLIEADLLRADRTGARGSAACDRSASPGQRGSTIFLRHELRISRSRSTTGAAPRSARGRRACRRWTSTTAARPDSPPADRARGGPAARRPDACRACAAGVKAA